MANPYEPGTDEYLDYATSQHDKAMAPKPKAKKQKKASQKVNQKKVGLAESFSTEQQRRKDMSGGIGSMFSRAFKK